MERHTLQQPMFSLPLRFSLKRAGSCFVNEPSHRFDQLRQIDWVRDQLTYPFGELSCCGLAANTTFR
jgi:hypothetical protein